jgi:effector-binding domain-containing protein
MIRIRTILAAGLAMFVAVAGLHSASAQTPAEPPAAPAQPAQPAQPSQPAPGPDAQPPAPDDPFGEEVQVPAKPIISLKGTASWDTAYETLLDAFKTVSGFLDKEGVKPAGPAMTIYLSTDDAGFEFRAAVPIEAPMANPPKGDIEAGESPGGRMLKFVHRGSYDAMDSTYEAITNFLDTKQLEAQDTFIEEYVTDPLKTQEDDLVINVLVPIK